MNPPLPVSPVEPGQSSTFRIPARQALLYYDVHKTESREIVQRLKPFEHASPAVILVVGGDGTMLRAIRSHWRDGVPFFGLNTGHIGFLLNEPGSLEFWNQDLRRYKLPLLTVELLLADGHRRTEVAFNDCWIERETGQTAWIEVSVNGVVRMPHMVSDGVLVASAAGSTSYARAMGATPLPFNAPLLTLAGSNVLKPEFWHPAVMSLDSVISVRNLDPEKRPLRGFIDGLAQGIVTEMTVRVSPVASVELLFTREHDPVAKLAQLQFPEPNGR